MSSVPQYVYRVNPATGVLEKHATMGEGVTWFSDGNSRPQPASPPIFAVNPLPPIPAEKLGRGIVFTGPDSQDPTEDKSLLAAKAQQRKQRELAAQEYVKNGGS